METKARIKIILQQIRAGRRRIESAQEHCNKGGIPNSIDDILHKMNIVELELINYGRNQD